MAAPKKSIDTNPELAFVDVDLLDLRRRLKETGEWSRALVAGCMEFVAGVQEDDLDPRRNAPQRSQYRSMLRQLLELEDVPPPRRKRGTVAAGAKRAMPGLIRWPRQRRDSPAASSEFEAAA